MVDVIGIVLLSVGMGVCILSIVFIGCKLMDVVYDTVEVKRKLNKPYKCHTCEIVSREYQLLDGEVCPQCSVHMRKYVYETKDINREFPFAPKLTFKEAILIKKQQNKINKINNDMRKLEEYDSQIESWEKLQLKKLEELESKANEIKAELAKKDVK